MEGLIFEILRYHPLVRRESRGALRDSLCRATDTLKTQSLRATILARL